jgi:hypothetical protein
MESIDPEGDLIMVVGVSEQEMRVNSNCLRLASPVFRSMFGPNWSEGQHLSKEAPPRVPLPEDDAATMRTIFYVLHHQTEPGPAERTPLAVLNLAICLHKYDLVVPFRYFASSQWLRDVGDNNDTLITKGQLATAGFLLGLKDPFEKYTASLALYHTESYLRLLADANIAMFLPIKAICESSVRDSEKLHATFLTEYLDLLEEGRNRMRTSIWDILVCGMCDRCRKKGCDWGHSREQRYYESFPEKGMFRPNNSLQNSVNVLLEELGRDTDETEADMNNDSKAKHRCHGHKLEVTDTFAFKANALKQGAGLCLDCVRLRSDETCEVHTVD